MTISTAITSASTLLIFIEKTPHFSKIFGETGKPIPVTLCLFIPESIIPYFLTIVNNKIPFFRDFTKFFFVGLCPQDEL